MAREIVLVTGAGGRIGSQVVRRLQEEYEVVGFELPKMVHNELRPIDLSSDESIKNALQKVKADFGNKIASVIHLAAYYSFDQKHSDLYEKVTVRGTEKLLKALQEFEVEQFIFSSTMLVYKPTVPGEKINEDAPVEPKWDYPLSKVRTEEIIHAMRGDTATVILRIAGVYDDMCHSIPISHQIQRIYEKDIQAHFFSGNTDHGAAFMHMDDLIDAIVLAVQKRKELPKETVLILGEEKTLSYDQLQRKISEIICGKPIKTFRVPKLLAKLGSWILCHIPFKEKPFIKPWMIDLADDHYELDISRAKMLLEWAPKRGLEETLPKMIEKLKQDPDGWYKANGL